MIATKTLFQIDFPMEHAIAQMRTARAQRYAPLRKYYVSAGQVNTRGKEASP